MRLAITLPEVNGFGWNSGYSEYIVWSWPWQILGAIRAEARAERQPNFFCQVNNARLYRFPVSQISRNLKTNVDLRGGESFRKTFVKICPLGVFFPKTSTFAWTSSTTSNFRLWFLRNEYKSWKVTTGWHAYGMLAFHLYHWNQLKVIPLARRARTRSVLSNATSRVIYILKKI